VELEEKLLSFLGSVGPELPFSLIDLIAEHLEGDGLTGFSSHQQGMPALVQGLNPLLVGRHEVVGRMMSLVTLGKLMWNRWLS
jgi:hypothetical protein